MTNHQTALRAAGAWLAGASLLLALALPFHGPLHPNLEVPAALGRRLPPQGAGRLAIRDTGIRKTLSDRGIAAREEPNHLIAFGEEWPAAHRAMRRAQFVDYCPHDVPVRKSASKWPPFNPVRSG